nr:MAG TPA: ParB-like nuclease domain [Caudoviricetes sp.]
MCDTITSKQYRNEYNQIYIIVDGCSRMELCSLLSDLYHILCISLLLE